MRETLIGQNVNARMHTMSFTLSGSSPSLALIIIENEKTKKGELNVKLRYIK